MSRSRSPHARRPLTTEARNLVSKTTASVLAQSGTINHNLKLLKCIVAYWQSLPIDDGGTNTWKQTFTRVSTTPTT